MCYVSSAVWYKTKFGSQNLVTICAWLPKLVANVSSNFHHLVNTGLAVGSFFQMATNNSSPHLQIRHNLSGLLFADWKWLHPIVITLNPSNTILYHIIIRGSLNIFLKTLYILQKDTKVGSQNFGCQTWFCTRLFRVSSH